MLKVKLFWTASVLALLALQGSQAMANESAIKLPLNVEVVTTSQPDRLISDPALLIVAPEFSPAGDEMSHCGLDGMVHIMALNAGGGFVDPTGQSDTILGACNFSRNGPEWGYSATELLLAWTTPESDGGATHLALATRPFESATWSEQNPLPGSEELRTPYPIRSILSKRPWLLYRSGALKRASMIFDLAGGNVIPSGSPYPTWLPDSYEIADVDQGTGQIVIVNAVTGQQRIASGSTSSTRFNPWVWVAPETGAEAALILNYDSGCIEFYDQVAESSLPSKQLCASDFAPDAEIITPEPFILRQRSYVSFAVRTVESTEIYVAGAIDRPLEEPYLERTSSGVPRVRRDPEPVTRWYRAYVYYTAQAIPQSSILGVWQTAVQGRPPYTQIPETSQ